MKNTFKFLASSLMVSALCFSGIALYAQEQTSAPTQNTQTDTKKPTIAVLNIDTKNISQDAQTMGYIVRLELEKTGRFNVMDKYEATEIAKRHNIDLATCYSKSCLVETGRFLNVDKMMSGSVEKIEDKIVVSLRIIDVKSGTIEKSDATEYLNLPEIQKMVQLSIEKVLNIPSNKVIVGQLINYDVPIQSPKNSLKLNGPRMGFSMLTGDALSVMTAKKEVGGFEMFPVNFQFGWQQEFQYISAGNFQALIENFFMIGGLESGRFIPSYSPLLGFRFGKGAWEFAFGPTFSLIQKADGYYDAENNWHLSTDWDFTNGNNPYSIVKRLDSRGSTTISTGLIIAFGKTFHSGYLNIPLNIYVAPRKDGTTIGANFGFNIQKKENAIAKENVNINKD